MPLDPLSMPRDPFLAEPGDLLATDLAPAAAAAAPAPPSVAKAPVPARVAAPTLPFSPSELTDGCVEGALRASLLGDAPQAMDRIIAATAGSAADRARLAGLLAGIMDRSHGWIERNPDLLRRAQGIVARAAPLDPAAAVNAAPRAAVENFRDWDEFPFSMVIVPGYTTDAQKEVLNETAIRRLDAAAADYEAGKAPFIFVSGGNVHPPGTQRFEGLDMRDYLVSVRHVPADRVIVDAYARHSTTNLRNAGRFMLEHQLKPAMIETVGGGIAGSDVFGQDFYFAHPTLSTFNMRCRDDLGYEVGEVGEVDVARVADSTAGREEAIAFTPARECQRVNIRDPLDP